MYCSNCGIELNDDVNFCAVCGLDANDIVNEVKAEKIGTIRVNNTEIKGNHTSHNTVRKGMTEAKFNEQSAYILFGEMAILAIGLGYLSHSWLVFGVVFFGLAICLSFPKVALILAVVLSLMGGIIGYSIGHYLLDSTGATVVLSVMGFLLNLAANTCGIQYAQDIDPN